MLSLVRLNRGSNNPDPNILCVREQDERGIKRKLSFSLGGGNHLRAGRCRRKRKLLWGAEILYRCCQRIPS